MRLLDKREYGELEAILKLDEKNLLKVMKILLEEEGYSNILRQRKECNVEPGRFRSR